MNRYGELFLAWFDKNGRCLGALFLALGLGTRLAQYLANRSLWLDEVYLAQNILHRSLAELIQPLDLQQSAPILFLFAEKISTLVVGTSEYGLRLVPLVSGIAAVFLFYLTARYFLARTFLVLAILVFAVLEPLVYYSSEVKQYSVDVLVALGLIYAAVKTFDAPLKSSHWVVLGGLGLVSIGFSDPAIFILAGIGCAWVWTSYREGWRTLWWIGLIGVLWVVGFGISYFVRLNSSAGNVELQNYWQDYFAPFPPVSFHQLRDLGNLVGAAFGYLFSPFPGFAELTVAIGLATATARKYFGLLIAPLLFCLVASGLHQYPFYQRFLLFSIPALIILAALGVQAIAQLMNSLRAKIVFTIVLGAILFPMLLDATLALVHPYQREEIRPVIHYLLAHRQKDDQLYVYYSSVEPLDYYLTAMRVPLVYSVGINARSDWLAYERDLAKWRGKGRVWFLFSHILRSDGVDEEKLYTLYLNRIGQRLDEYQQPGASVYLYDLGIQ